MFLNANLPLIIFRCASLLLQAIMITVYTLRILHLKREHMQRLEENYSFMEDIDLHWLNQAIPLAAFFAFVALFASCFPFLLIMFPIRPIVPLLISYVFSK